MAFSNQEVNLLTGSNTPKIKKLIINKSTLTVVWSVLAVANEITT